MLGTVTNVLNNVYELVIIDSNIGLKYIQRLISIRSVLICF